MMCDVSAHHMTCIVHPQHHLAQVVVESIAEYDPSCSKSTVIRCRYARIYQNTCSLYTVNMQHAGILQDSVH